MIKKARTLMISLKKIFLNRRKKEGLFKYKNYNHYKKVQIEGNIRKINNCWVDENNIRFLSKYLEKKISNIKFGICHGTRRGKEQEWFRKYLGVDVLGTDISPTANQFPNTIEWDFHKIKSRWINNTDFIYSNSLDHSYNPKECLSSWMECLKIGGVVILEWSTGHIESTELDPFGGTLKTYKKLVQPEYKIVKILKSPNNRFWNYKKTFFVVVSHKN